MNKVTIAGLVVAGCAAATIGVLAGRGSVDKPAKETKTVSTAETATTAKPVSGLVEIKDQETGFAFSYPAGWKLLPSKDSDVVAVIVESAGSGQAGGSILARVTKLDVELGPGGIAEARKLTDAVVSAGAGVEMKVDPTEVTIGGLPGYFYFYTFADSASGQRGAHSHYFLFKGKSMISLVFQGVPESDFVRLAPTFDTVANSFRVLN